MAQYEIIEKHEPTGFQDGSWHAKVKLADGRVLHVGLNRGNRVWIAFKPREHGFGYHWFAYVRTEKGETLHHERCPKSIGVHGILRDAGLIACEHRTVAGRDYCSCGAHKLEGVWRTRAEMETPHAFEPQTKDARWCKLCGMPDTHHKVTP